MSKYTAIPYSGYGNQGLQVFTPARIEEVSAGGILSTVKVSCIRIASPTRCRLNSSGDYFTLPEGWSGISNNTYTLQFEESVSVEIMEGVKEIPKPAINLIYTEGTSCQVDISGIPGASFKISLNGIEVTRTTETSYTLSGLIPGRENIITVSQVVEGIYSNYSKISLESTATTAVPNVTHTVVDVTDTTIDLSFANLISGASINITVSGNTTTITGSTYQITGQIAESIVNISYTQTVDGQTSSSTSFSVTMGEGSIEGGDYSTVLSDSVFGIDSSILSNITTNEFNQITSLIDHIGSEEITDIVAKSGTRTLNEVNAIDIPDAGYISLPILIASHFTGDCSFIFAFAIDDMVRITKLLDVVNGVSITVDPVDREVSGTFGNGSVTLSNVDIDDDVHVLVLERSGSNLNIYLDTLTETAAGATDVSGVTEINLVPDFNGALGEFIILPRSLTASEKTDLGVAA